MSWTLSDHFWYGCAMVRPARAALGIVTALVLVAPVGVSRPAPGRGPSEDRVVVSTLRTAAASASNPQTPDAEPTVTVTVTEGGDAPRSLLTMTPAVPRATSSGAPAALAPPSPAPAAPVAPNPDLTQHHTIASFYGYAKPVDCYDHHPDGTVTGGPVPPGLVYWTANKTLPCGAWITVTGPAGSIRLQVWDRGPYVGPSRDLDLSPAAFVAVAGSERAGIVQVTWEVG